MSQSQITDYHGSGEVYALEIALSELFFGASSDVIILRANFSTVCLLASCFFSTKVYVTSLRMTGPFQDWSIGCLVFGIR
jgi:hypothetical protein